MSFVNDMHIFSGVQKLTVFSFYIKKPWQKLVIKGVAHRLRGGDAPPTRGWRTAKKILSPVFMRISGVSRGLKDLKVLTHRKKQSHFLRYAII